MKIYDIVAKDLKRTFQSAFSLVMMFGAPLLITGLLYFAFGGLTRPGGAYALPVTRVVVANLDQPAAGFAAGQLLVAFLQDESLADVLAVSPSSSEAEARAAVDSQQADVAVIIPADFSAAATTPEHTAAVSLYQDPTLTVGPGIVSDLVSHFMDGFSGAKIAGQTAAGQLAASGLAAQPGMAAQVAQQYAAWLQSGGHDAAGTPPRLAIVSPEGEAQPSRQAVVPIGAIMAGMLVFFVFFIGANGAQSLIEEDEAGTLARLVTTPTPVAAILSGKFLAVALSLVLQMLVLMLAAIPLFGMSWGRPATVGLVGFGLTVAAAGFGVLVMAFIKNSRQTGPVLGGVMTLTGMLGGLFTTALPNAPAALDTVSLATPQGWAMQGFKLALAGAGPAQVLAPVAVLLVMGAVFMTAGGVLFRRRFA